MTAAVAVTTVIYLFSYIHRSSHFRIYDFNIVVDI